MSSASTSRRVTFNTNAMVFDILSIYDFTPSEISATWYDDREMDKLSDRCFQLIQKHMEDGQRSKYCMRGLERHTPTGSISKKHNRNAAYKAVFEKQSRHWDDNEETKNQAISAAYHSISSSCQMWAQVVGNRDQQAVEAYLYEDNLEDKRTLAPSSCFAQKELTTSCLKNDAKILLIRIGATVSTSAVAA